MNNNFKNYAQLAKWSYSKVPRVEFGSDAMIHFTDKDDGEVKLFIVFAGTDDYSDMKKNIFNEYQIEEAIDQLFMYLADSFTKRLKIVLIGHSRGGRYAVEVGEALKGKGLNVEKIITFGCPKVKIKKAIVPHFRLVNGLDGVPSMPPFFYGCKHHCKKIQLMNAPKWWQSWFKLTGTALDHPINDYIESLK